MNADVAQCAAHRQRIEDQLASSAVNSKIAAGVSALVKDRRLDPRLCLISALVAGKDAELAAALSELALHAGAQPSAFYSESDVAELLQAKLTGAPLELEARAAVAHGAAPPHAPHGPPPASSLGSRRAG